MNFLLKRDFSGNARNFFYFIVQVLVASLHNSLFIPVQIFQVPLAFMIIVG